MLRRPPTSTRGQPASSLSPFHGVTSTTSNSGLIPQRQRPPTSTNSNTPPIQLHGVGVVPMVAPVKQQSVVSAPLSQKTRAKTKGKTQTDRKPKVPAIQPPSVNSENTHVDEEDHFVMDLASPLHRSSFSGDNAFEVHDADEQNSVVEGRKHSAYEPSNYVAPPPTAPTTASSRKVSAGLCVLSNSAKRKEWDSPRGRPMSSMPQDQASTVAMTVADAASIPFSLRAIRDSMMQLNSEYELGVRDQIEEKREHAAIKIQHFWRGIMAKAAAQNGDLKSLLLDRNKEPKSTKRNLLPPLTLAPAVPIKKTTINKSVKNTEIVVPGSIPKSATADTRISTSNVKLDCIQTGKPASQTENPTDVPTAQPPTVAMKTAEHSVLMQTKSRSAHSDKTIEPSPRKVNEGAIIKPDRSGDLQKQAITVPPLSPPKTGDPVIQRSNTICNQASTCNPSIPSSAAAPITQAIEDTVIQSKGANSLNSDKANKSSAPAQVVLSEEVLSEQLQEKISDSLARSLGRALRSDAIRPPSHQQTQTLHDSSQLSSAARLEKLLSDSDLQSSIPPEKMDSDFSQPTAHTPNKGADNKISSFLKYLSEAETGSVVPPPAQVQVPIVPTLGASLDGGNLMYDAVKARIVGLQVEIQDKTKTIQLLKKALKENKQREAEKKLQDERNERLLIQKCEEEAKAKLAQQETQFQDVLARHLEFIDRLMLDKKELSNKCESLIQDIQLLEKQYESKLQEAKTQAETEAKKNREQYMTQEKASREKWEKQKLREIKEETTKGLEPEINKLIGKQKSDIQLVESKWKLELEKQREALNATHQQELRNLRSKIEQEFQTDYQEARAKIRDDICEEERRERQQLEASMKRMRSDFEKELARISEERERERQSFKQQLQVYKESEAAFTQRVTNAVNDSQQELKRRHDIAHLKEAFAVEKDQWQTRLMKKYEQDLKQAKEAIRQNSVQEREAQMEEVIAKLEEETTSEKAKLQAELSRKLIEVQDKCNASVVVAQNAEKEWRNKFIEAGKSQMAAEEKLNASQPAIATLESRTQELERKLRATEQELGGAKEKLRAMETDAKSREISQSADSRLKIEQLETALRLEQESKVHLEREKEQQLSDLEARVKQTISRKEELIASLRERLKNEEMKREQLELHLEKQRQELLNLQ